MKSIRDKIAVRGVGELSDAELLAVVIEDETLAEKIISECGSLSGVVRMELPRLRMIEGLGLRRAEKVAASAELGRRLAAAEAQNVDSIATSDDIVRIFRPIVEGLSHEECWVLFLTNSNRIIERQRVSQGGVQATIVDNRLIVKRALELLSTQIVLVHNHPSGAAEPSDADIALTRKVREAAALFDIRLLDHIIIAGTGSYSFRSGGLL
jgi:UPF0758 protein fjoh_0413